MTLLLTAPPSGVLCVPPAVGAAPTPPRTLANALLELDRVAALPPCPAEVIAARVGSLLRHMVSDQPGMPERHRAAGLVGPRLAAWADSLMDLSPGDREALLAYAASCRHWEWSLRLATRGPLADPDWDMPAAPGVTCTEVETALVALLACAGLPVAPQVGVARGEGGARRGGWHDAFWLDCAIRDPSTIMRIDAELDGSQHYHGSRPRRDQRRNLVLSGRGWYVVRVTSAVIGAPPRKAALLAWLTGLIAQHRRAVLLARSDLPTLRRMLASGAPRGP